MAGGKDGRAPAVQRSSAVDVDTQGRCTRGRHISRQSQSRGWLRVGNIRVRTKGAPDPEDVEVGATYPFVLGFQVPTDEADQLAGLAVDVFSWRSYPLLRPAT